MTDQPSTYPLAQERSQTRCNEVHLLGEVAGERFAVLCDRDNTAGKCGDIEHVDLGE